MESHPGLARVCPGHPGHGLTAGSAGFCRVVAPAGLLTNSDRSRSTRRAGPGLITMNMVTDNRTEQTKQ